MPAVGRVHVVVPVERRRLWMALLRVLPANHRAVGRLGCAGLGLCLGLRLCSLCSLCLCSSGLRPLLAQRFGLQLLLRTWGWRPVQGTRFEIHRRHELPRELLLSDERVQLRLLWRPSFERVDGQQTPDEVDKGNAVVHL